MVARYWRVRRVCSRAAGVLWVSTIAEMACIHQSCNRYYRSICHQWPTFRRGDCIKRKLEMDIPHEVGCRWSFILLSSMRSYQPWILQRTHRSRVGNSSVFDISTSTLEWISGPDRGCDFLASFIFPSSPPHWCTGFFSAFRVLYICSYRPPTGCCRTVVEITHSAGTPDLHCTIGGCILYLAVVYYHTSKFDRACFPLDILSKPYTSWYDDVSGLQLPELFRHRSTVDWPWF